MNTVAFQHPTLQSTSSIKLVGLINQVKTIVKTVIEIKPDIPPARGN